MHAYMHTYSYPSNVPPLHLYRYCSVYTLCICFPAKHIVASCFDIPSPHDTVIHPMPFYPALPSCTTARCYTYTEYTF